MAGSSLQSRAGQEERDDHRRSRLKIRRAPSSAAQASCASSSFHGSCKKMMIKKDCTISKPNQPLIFHTFDPEVIITEPVEFMALVQRLTGSPATRKLLRASTSRKQKKMESQVRSILDTESPAQLDPLKEGRTIILAPAAGISCTANADHSPASPAYPNCNGLSNSISPKPQILSGFNRANYGAKPLAASSLPRLNLNANHPTNHPPLASISANSATYEENCSSAYTSPMSSNSPLSPNCSLTTSCSEGCFSMEEGGAFSSYREAFCFLEEEGSTQRTDQEEGGINYFVFSGDSYYGSHDYTIPNALDP